MTASVRNVCFLSRALDSTGGSIYVNLLLVEAFIRQEEVSTDRNRLLYAAAVPVTSCQLWNRWAMTWR
jgi:hypothetical protein